MTTRSAAWAEANQRHLTAAVAAARAWLEGRGGDPPQAPASAGTEDPPALARLVDVLGLSAFERGILLLAAGVELDARFPALLAAAQGDPQRAWPTFGLAMAVVPGAHWSALSPARPLRWFRLVEPAPAPALLAAPLRIDERVLHFLCGLDAVDARLGPLLEEVRAEGDPLPPSQQSLATACAGAWAGAQGPPPLLQLCGEDAGARRALFAAACAAAGLRGWTLPASAAPVGAAEVDAFARLWEREAALERAALLVELDTIEEPPRSPSLSLLLERLPGAVAAAGHAPRPGLRRATRVVDVARPRPAEQRGLWRAALGPEVTARLDGQLDAVVAQFSLGADAIRAVAARSLPAGPRLAEALWEECRAEARPRLDDLAQRIEPAAAWDDLVLPDLQREVLRDIAAHVRCRATVYERWGFGARSGRGLGVTALFSGASGTGKTMAAEVLARELRLDLYRVDLSQVVSKYIGDTERNLRRVFDAAEGGGAILLFDEADALFGRRTEVKDSHDRYANLEVSYLLQRMEQYRGLAILTTNVREALDPAFLRRLRFAVSFPFPDAAHRAEIWRRIFPPQTPTQGLEPELLARLNVPGGNIHAIALSASFLAAGEGQPVRMAHVLRAARAEFLKLERPLTEAEIGGWA